MNENSGVKVCEYHNQKCPTPFQTNYEPNTLILYLEITDQLLVTDNRFLEKPDQGSGTQRSVENISNKLPLRDSEFPGKVGSRIEDQGSRIMILDPAFAGNRLLLRLLLF